MIDLLAFVLLLAVLVWWFRGYWPTWRRLWRSGVQVVRTLQRNGNQPTSRGYPPSRRINRSPLRVVDVTPKGPKNPPN